MKAYIDRAHAERLRVKIYYTVRELANRAPELFALRSLGEEIFAPGPGGGYLVAAGAPRLQLHRRVVRARAQGRRHRQQRRVALAQLLRRRARLARPQRRHRRPLHRRRGVRPDDDEAGAEGAGPGQARRADRPALGQPVQRARRVRQQREPLPRALPVPQPPLVRRVLRLQLGARLLADGDLGHPVRPDGRDAAGRRQPVARHGVRHDRPAAVGRRPATDVEGVGRVRHRRAAG